MTALMRLLFIALSLLSAVGLGVLVLQALSLPKEWTVLVCLAVGGLCVFIVWTALQLPIVPVLRLALLASFWFRLEINLFPVIKQGHETPLGIIISLSFLLNMLLLGAFFYQRWQRGKPVSLWPSAFTWTVLVLVLLSGLSALQSPDKWLGLFGLWGLATELLICFIAAVHFRSTEVLRAALLLWAIAILLNSLLGILQYLEIFGGWGLLGATVGERQMSLPGMEVLRASGLLESPNSFGWVLATFLPIVLAPALLAKDALRVWERRLCLSAFFCGVLALFLTFSRGSWLAVMLTLPILATFVIRALPARARWRMLTRLGGAVILLSLLSLPFLEPLSARLLGEDDGAAESRIPLMEVAVAMIQDNPWLGVGISNYEAVMRRYDNTESFISESFPSPVHNLYLHVAAEAGIPVLLCLLTMIGITLYCGWKTWRNTAPDNALPRALAIGMMTGMLAYLISAMKEPTSFDSGQIRNLFLLFGFLIALEHLSRNSGRRAGKERP